MSTAPNPIRQPVPPVRGVGNPERIAIIQPSVDAERLRWVNVPNDSSTLKGLNHSTARRGLIQSFQGWYVGGSFTQGSSPRNPRLDDFHPVGMLKSASGNPVNSGWFSSAPNAASGKSCPSVRGFAASAH